MSEIGEKGVAAAQGPPLQDESLLDCDPNDAELVATEEALAEVGRTVNELVRTNSLPRERSGLTGKPSIELDEIGEEDH